ncbi:sugar transferase [Brevirhabdus pacifica]|uniref:sugar transferase n=2 Tax=Brevirhabdus pacifica TaxID=1267768 RepID=UPI001F19A468|nr:sugar transferase [Brevirhabdus pacifica]
MKGLFGRIARDGSPRGAGRAARALRYRDGLKRGMDVAGSLALAPLWLPLVALCWALVRLDGGPGFYGHARVGRDGRIFRCWKLRSMCPDATARLRRHLRADPAAAREWAQGYKLSRDPRVTPLGRLLRRYRVDELPQFWNVLRGEMSLVGPRPVTAAELAEYRGRDWAYTTFRPGLTGIWQVSGQPRAYEARIRMDCAYLMRAGPGTDLAILGRTLGVILRGSGV